ncbi:hypothetical protein PSCICE_13360 [Pseudomonas cichorii]|nr:hypothetical protein PSCICE_13360 [Pseudomonas cichorii]
MGRHHLDFIRDAELFQHIGGVAKGGPIGLGAHDHANQCAHRRASHRAPAGASKNNKPRGKAGVACCTNNGRFNRPKAAQYTSKRKDESPPDDHLHEDLADTVQNDLPDDLSARKNSYGTHPKARLNPG